MTLICRVLRMHRRKKKSAHEIVKATGLWRDTVRTYLRIGKAGAPQYRRPAVPTKLLPVLEAVQQAVQAEARQPKKVRRHHDGPSGVRWWRRRQ